MINKLIGLFSFLSAFLFYLVQVAPSVTAGDSGEFITSAGTLSLAHAPSFPLYMLLGRTFSELIPWGTTAFHLNVFSAFTSSLALLFLYLIGRELKISRFGCLMIVLTMGMTQSFWANSLVTEVFSLNTWFSVFLLWLIIKISVSTSEFEIGRLLCFSAFVFGLGLGNHHVLVFLGTGFVICLFKNKKAFHWKFILGLCFFFLIGLSVYLSLPIRSMNNPPLNWGQPTTVSKLIRTMARKDYGSMRLALEESPERTMTNTIRHARNFTRQISNEMTWPLLILSIGGILFGFWRRSGLAFTLLVLFIFSGPFFYLLGNLPFSGQSEGIMGRFFIMPVLFLTVSLFLFGSRLLLVVPLLLFIGGLKAASLELNHRFSTLILDYGRSMLRSMPPGSILFMDGGDDAFYSLAMLQYVDEKRTDVELHDRGGLVFKNPYGTDFRSLTRELKQDRRMQVERRYLGIRPLFYSTMDTSIMPGSSLFMRGFLYEVDGQNNGGMDWPLLCLRALYPTQPNDYRTRALAAFFPYMRGKKALEQDDYGKALDFFKRSQDIGPDVDWLKVNLSDTYARWAYDSLSKGRFALAEWIYSSWINFDPTSMQAQSNLGVAYEKQGKFDDARKQYEKAAALFPEAHDPVYNLAVLAWKEEKWTDVIQHLNEVLRRYPTHAQARIYLEQAKQKAYEADR